VAEAHSRALLTLKEERVAAAAAAAKEIGGAVTAGALPPGVKVLAIGWPCISRVYVWSET
jgi:hypothetical protein